MPEFVRTLGHCSEVPSQRENVRYLIWWQMMIYKMNNTSPGSLHGPLSRLSASAGKGIRPTMACEELFRLKIAACHTVLYQDIHHRPLISVGTRASYVATGITSYMCLPSAGALRVGSGAWHHWRI